MKPVRIAQIGIGHNHADATMATLRKFPRYFEVVGVAEDDPKWLERRRGLKAYEGLSFKTEAELLATPGLEAVCVEKDVPDNEEAALRCARLGLHIHMDKPGGEDYAAFRELVETQRRGGRAFQMAYMYRYNPAVRQCLDMARSGALGDLFEIDCQMSTTHSPVYRQWLSNFKGGDMYVFGSHLVDLVVWMLGEPEKVVTHNMNSFPEEARCIDNGLAVLQYPRATCTVRTTSLEANGYHRRQLVVCGTKGTVEIKPMENPTKMSVAWRESSGGPGAPDAREWIDLPDVGGRYDAQLVDFARIVRGEIENPFGYDHELAVERTLLRACGIPFGEQPCADLQ